MEKKNNTYRSQILFIGLTTAEMMNVETVFNRYSVFYKDTMSKFNRFDNYDLICLTEAEYVMKGHHLAEIKIPFFVIGEESVKGCAGIIKRSEFIRLWLETVKQILPPAKTPEIEKIMIGSVVRAKSMPLFGKGVVTAFVTESEVLVKFPTTNLLSKDMAIKCHLSQLQNLGKLEDLAKKLVN
ncbi:MAG: hypothetical protein H7281_04295 [Bacteriovorax sp.]|nr:hypothetical protein [Bacteriovorax sp.]